MSWPASDLLGPWRRARRSDVLACAAVAGVGTTEILAEGYQPVAVALGTFWLAAAVLLAHRAIALAVPVLTSGIYLLTPVLGFDVDQLACWLIVFIGAGLAAGLGTTRSRLPWSLAGILASLALAMAGLALSGAGGDLLFGVIVIGGPWSLGVALRHALDRNAELAIEAERARAEGERAVGAERARIARELHDVLAHSLSVMVVQASLAEDLIPRDPAAAGGAVREVQRSGRAALGETGRLLHLIRDRDDALGMSPQHVVSDIPALVQDYARAGLEVDLVLGPGLGEPSLGVGLSAYRIVQEALTNALTHAPGSRVSVRVERRDEDLAIEVRNGSGSETAGRAAGRGGHGLAGVRERVLLFGGTLHAAPTGDGGFVLAATLPSPAGAE